MKRLTAAQQSNGDYTEYVVSTLGVSGVGPQRIVTGGNGEVALVDCFRDFGWLNEYNIVLVHPELPKLPQSELPTYLRLLRDSVLDWRPGEAHRFDVISPNRTRRLSGTFCEMGS
ncbi:hypothetical protein [Cupriavidus plantarum]|uniref:hypothetical protein n=1 Tax=Cupriavidus plantarum TaxID=942865 RepID=UPI0015CC77F7|nr:hypothetical protein [Cupriavidus plantarum]NYI01182.1 hypothetical protein [Cupriavidus plantarum]